MGRKAGHCHLSNGYWLPGTALRIWMDTQWCGSSYFTVMAAIGSRVQPMFQNDA